MEPFISFEHVTKTYRMGEVDIKALNGVDFMVNKGEFAVVVGPSGAGKSTILNVLGGMDSCDGGKITVDGRLVSAFNKKELTAYRRSDIGFVFQFYNLVQNLTAKDIEYTIDRMEKAIRSSQIIMIPGGFSGGDEPEGSGKFIATTFRNPKIAQAVTDLLDTRDGLMLGICNGFQALIKLGLVTYGKIVDLKDNDPTLTFNTLGRHVSRMVYTRVTNTKSPWLSGVNAGDVFAIPVSHGEGRFVADDAALRRLIENGQIATQYTTPCGKVSGDITWNPNGSVCGIEGITSPDGRVFGKMGHSERKGDNLYFNVPGEKDQQIFESGVRYFK